MSPDDQESGGLDLVYTWVDGSDPAFYAKKSMWQYKLRPTGEYPFRYSDHDELKYSLRSFEKHNEFIKRIFVVHCDSQIPIWLLESPKLKLIPHSEIMPPEYLPTYSAYAIESFLHRIPGLSEYFLYANDDFFFNTPLTRELFFAGPKPKILLQDGLSPEVRDCKHDFSWAHAVAIANKLLDSVKRERRKHVAHVPYMASKSICELCWRRFPAAFAANAASKFRGGDSLSFPHLVSHMMLYHGVGVASKTRYRMWCRDGRRYKRLRAFALRNKFVRRRVLEDVDYFCINNGREDILDAILPREFPQPSSFEQV